MDNETQSFLATDLREIVNSGGKVWLSFAEELAEYLRRIWDPDGPRTLFQGPPFPEWSIGMTERFIKSTSNIDRKLQGRILEALARIYEMPVSSHGDTIKPLSGEMAGFWRFRIGDFRLIYWPDVENKRILLVDFSSRGSVYD
jgi:mRNA-degrading endonuclease RelE of RelBE toxin-antitoxin system